jgi:hypothetical protein
MILMKQLSLQQVMELVLEKYFIGQLENMHYTKEHIELCQIVSLIQDMSITT